MAKKPKINKNDQEVDPRLRFLEFCKNFPIDLFDIPRPLKSNRQEISDETCVLTALSLLGISHEMWPEKELQPIGWLLGPHLLDLERFEDYSLGFSDEPLKSILSENPWLIVIESPVQLAVAILRHKCNSGNPRESRFAKTILRDLNLELFISESSKKRRTEDLTLSHYKRNPEILASQVALYKQVIQKFFNPPYKREELIKKREDIEKAFELIFKKEMPEDLIFGERDKSPANIALAFLSYETAARYDSLHGIYYKEAKEVKPTDVLKALDFITDNKGEKGSYIEELKRGLEGTDT